MKEVKIDAVAKRKTCKEKFLLDIMNFKFKVVPTIRRKDSVMGIGKWIPYQHWVTGGRREKVDYYNILPNEIVFESDFTAKKEVIENGHHKYKKS